MAQFDYHVDFEPLSAADGGGYVATVPDLPGCMSDGETYHEAEMNLEDAIASWIDHARAIGRPIPAPTSNHRQHA